MLNPETIIDNWFMLLRDQNEILRDIHTAYSNNLSNMIDENHRQNRDMTYDLLHLLII